MKIGDLGVDVGDIVLWPATGRGIILVRLLVTEDGDRLFEARELHDGSRTFVTDLDSLTEDFDVVKMVW